MQARVYDAAMPPFATPPAHAALDFTLPAHELAPLLIGVTLLVDGVGGRIVETEAYDGADPASHSFRGRTARNAAMFGPPGRAYVYRSYGVHWCLNLVCGSEGDGSAVLVRALEPTQGLQAMCARRGTQDERLLCAGPGRLAQALGIDARFDHLPLDVPPFALQPRPRGAPPPALVAGPRIGITKAADVPWRFGEAGSRYLSRPFPAQALATGTGCADAGRPKTRSNAQLKT